MSIKDSLLELGLSEEQVSGITKQIAKEFVTKDQYNKVSGNKSEVESKINELEAALSESNSKLSKLEDIKTNYDALTTEYNNYKNEVETKEINSTKTSLLKELFKSEGYNDQILKHMIKDVDLSKLELEDGNIKASDEMFEAVRKEYEPFKQVIETTGATPANPPSDSSRTFTREDIQNMSTEQINANWDSVSKALSNIK